MNYDELSLYEQVGGAQTFQRLVDAFYARVEQDALLRPMFPSDLEPGKQHQFLFLSQYWGGPATYSSERGHPRLRMRHAPYPITPEMSARWLEHMLAAIDEAGIAEPARSTMRDYFEQGARFLINQITIDERNAES